MTQNEEFKALFDKYTQGTATPEEVARLESVYLNWNKQNKRIYSKTQLKEIHAEAWENIVARAKLDPAYTGSIKPVRLWPRIGIAAAVATIVISAGIWFLKNPTKESPIQQSAYIDDVAPGKQGATLTLASGKKILLSDASNGQLAKEAGVSISKSADGKLVYEITEHTDEENKINILSTAKGETYEVRLPDGSLVTLNAASSLEYPANFTAMKERRVNLTGEGYFEIAKDTAHPFIVQSKGQQVEVLGTHFNIKAYPDEPTMRTTLLEGSVKVSQESKTEMLKPGQEAESFSNRIVVKQVDPQIAVAWKNNEFLFQGERIGYIMKMVERWYNVEVIYQGEMPIDEFVGGVSRFDKISKVLVLLESTGKVHFKIEGRKIYVSR